MVQNLIWSGLYLMSTFLSVIIQNILKLVPMTATGPEVYVATTTTVLSNSYDSLVDTMNHTKSLNLMDNQGENVTDFFDKILVDVERLDSAVAFKL